MLKIVALAGSFMIALTLGGCGQNHGTTIRHKEIASNEILKEPRLDKGRASRSMDRKKSIRVPKKPAITKPRDIPRYMFRLYLKHGKYCKGMTPWILAAIGRSESNHWRNRNISSEGARGPMGFMPATFRAYGVDGNRDGRKNILDPHDSVPSSANYLCKSGITRSVHKALYAYNHAEWYVRMILDRAKRYKLQAA